jgi:MOSC domain-containing protein YiiM
VGAELAVRVVSLNVGLPRLVAWRGRTVSTGIFKEAVSGPVRVHGINFDGDAQADLELHGGPDKAVYVYPSEHYAFWERELGEALPWGMFGENLTVAGLPLEDELAVGDRLRIGSAELEVAQPRLPWGKLGVRFGDAAMVRRFFAAERTGYYVRIVSPGVVESGDDIAIVSRDPAAVPVSAVTQVVTRDGPDADALRRVLTASALPVSWRLHAESVVDTDNAHGTSAGVA